MHLKNYNYYRYLETSSAENGIKRLQADTNFWLLQYIFAFKNKNYKSS